MSQTSSSPVAASPSAAPPPPLSKPGSLQTEDEYERLKRFQIELEFVQCLSNPWYLHRTFRPTLPEHPFDIGIGVIDTLQWLSEYGSELVST
jgi:hypothetical protein